MIQQNRPVNKTQVFNIGSFFLEYVLKIIVFLSLSKCLVHSLMSIGACNFYPIRSGSNTKLKEFQLI